MNEKLCVWVFFCCFAIWSLADHDQEKCTVIFYESKTLNYQTKMVIHFNVNVKRSLALSALHLPILPIL